MIATVVLSVALAQGCTKDTDCKGERVCEAGRCVNPVPVAPVVQPPPPPMPSVDAGVEVTPPPLPRRPVADEYPKVVRKNGEVCVQALTEEGVVREDCRPEERVRIRSRRVAEPEPEAAPWRKREEPPQQQRSTFVADFGATGQLGLLLGGGLGLALPGLGLHGALGGRVTEAVGVFAVFDAGLFFAGSASVIAVTLAPGLRLGDGGHATLAVGPSLFVAASPRGSVTSVAGTVLLRGVFLVSGGFGIHTQFGLTFDATGVVIQLGVGLGGSVI